MKCMTFCEVCTKEKSDERREHLISEKHLKIENKNYCKLCNMKSDPKLQTSKKFNRSFFDMGCRSGHF